MKRFKNILLVISDKVENKIAVQRAVDLSKHNQARLTVIEVLKEFDDIHHFFDRDRTTKVLEALRKEKLEYLHTLLEPYRKGIEVDFLVSQGKPFYEIIRVVLLHNFDLVIKTCHQHGSMMTMLFGTTDMHLLRKCPCPVWLIKPQEKEQCRRILAAIDIEPSIDTDEMDGLNQQILEMATSLTILESAKLYIVHAWMVFGEDMLHSSGSDYLEEEVVTWIKDQKTEIKARLDAFKVKLNEMSTKQGAEHLHPEVYFLEGEASEIIPQIAEEKNVDLVIMGTIARTGLSGYFIGNTAESILNQLSCSILAVKPENFVSPLKI